MLRPRLSGLRRLGGLAGEVTDLGGVNAEAAIERIETTFTFGTSSYTVPSVNAEAAIERIETPVS